MTAEQYRQALTTLGLTYETAATWLGIGRSTSHRYTQVGCENRTAIKLLEVALAVRRLDRYVTHQQGMLPHMGGQWVRHSDLTAAVGL